MSQSSATDLESRLRSSRRTLQRIISEIESSPVDPATLLQRLQGVQETFELMLEQQAEDRMNARMAHLYYVSRLIGSSIELDTVLEMVMDAVIQLTGAQRGFLVLVENDELTLRTGRNFEQLSLDSGDMTISSTMVRRAVETGEPILVENAQQDTRFAGQASVISNQLLSVMVSPLRLGDEVLGAIYIDNNDYSALFTASELDLLGMFSEQAASAIHNAMEVERRERELRSQISELRIEIDEIKKAQQVADVTDNEDFRDLAAKAKRLREERNRGK